MTNQPKPTEEFVQQAVAQILCANKNSNSISHTIVQMLSAQLLCTIKMSIFSGCKTLYLAVALKKVAFCGII